MMPLFGVKFRKT